jgi:elongation factor Ts
MASYSAQEVSALRKATGAGILDCKKALEQNEGDVEAAKQWLREQGLVSAGKRADRESAEGAVSVVLTGGDPAVGAVVELRCETDFVAKSADYVALTDKLAASYAAEGDGGIDALADAVDELKVTLKENISVGRRERFEAVAGGVLGDYQHVQAGRGTIAVLVELIGSTPEIAHDIAVHIAFANPRYLTEADVPAETVAAERQTIETMARNEGKPDAALEKIIEGRLRGFYKELCLLDQAYVRDEKKTVAQYIGGATITRFARVAISG